jgi:endonuclease G, mitochondrial
MPADLNRTATLASMVRLSGADLGALEVPGFEPTTNPTALAGRNGYQPAFLDGWEIPLPLGIGPAAKDMRELRRGGRGVELTYRNFSVVMSASRRLPMITATNIDGTQARPINREDIAWSFDGRLDKEDQWGDEVYVHTLVDRGHMVRRLDPVWGSWEEAEQANEDTFHFTNSCPQVAAVNRRTWLGLENYILKNADVHDLRVNVYTGPFFGDLDRELPGGARAPLAFWKVVSIVTGDGRPSATAYKVSQEAELSELEFAFAGYKTFQISVQQVIDGTSIDFTSLVAYDGFSQHERETGEPLMEVLESLEQVRV